MGQYSGMYDVRDAVEADKNYIYASFLRGLYYGKSMWSELPKQVFMDTYKKVVETLVNNPDTVIKVACLKDDPNIILGYSILSNDFTTIHYINVKSVWRRGGIGRALVPQFPTTVTHLTAVGKSLLAKFKSEVTFNPFKI